MTTRVELQELASRRLKEFVHHSVDVNTAPRYALRATSGTTGNPLVFVSEPRTMEQYHVPYLLHGAERIVICYGKLDVQLAFARYMLTLPMDSEEKALWLVGGEGLEDDTFAERFAEFAPDRIHGTTSFVLRLAALVPEQAVQTVRSILLTGEPLSEAGERMLQERFPDARVRMSYAQGEMGAVSLPPCEYLARNRYHPRPGIMVEVLDADEAGVGEFVMTVQDSNIAPDITIDRYHTGDAGRIVEEPCPCGEKVTVEFAGRSDFDFVRLSGALLHREEFDRVAALFPGVIDDYRAESREIVSKEGSKGSVRLQIFCTQGRGTEVLAREVAERFSEELFVTPTRTLADMVRAGIFLSLSVEFVDKPFTSRAKDIKLRHRV